MATPCYGRNAVQEDWKAIQNFAHSLFANPNEGQQMGDWCKTVAVVSTVANALFFANAPSFFSLLRFCVVSLLCRDLFVLGVNCPKKTEEGGLLNHTYWMGPLVNLFDRFIVAKLQQHEGEP